MVQRDTEPEVGYARTKLSGRDQQEPDQEKRDERGRVRLTSRFRTSLMVKTLSAGARDMGSGTGRFHMPRGSCTPISHNH